MWINFNSFLGMYYLGKWLGTYLYVILGNWALFLHLNLFGFNIDHFALTKIKYVVLFNFKESILYLKGKRLINVKIEQNGKK